jgi:hypothetical protein
MPAKRALALICISIFLFFPLLLTSQQTATAPCIIHVSDPTGAAIQHAPLRLVPTPEDASVKLETNDRGELLINLKPGGYALFVSVPGFKKSTQRIDVVAASSQSSVIPIFPVVLQIADSGSPTPVYPRNSLVLTASLYHEPVVISPADFRALPHITISVHNSHSNATETYSGVALDTLLAKVNAPLGKDLHGEALACYLVASGSDGYSVVLSLAEVDSSFHGGQVLVADTRDDRPLADSGPFELIVSDDKRPARWVHNLNSVWLQSGR